MESYQINRSGCRPYNRTCGMMKPSSTSAMPMRRESSGNGMSCETSECSCVRPASPKSDNMYEHLKHLTPAMAYVPYQQFTSAYDLDYALSVGTIFPQLCKPFCGKRGVCR